ncbi:MAG: beta-mannosidase [Oscillospiraceae bacterium]|jgi:mannan endo-1,4-beta-mannosidase|nr:beta-mannosidase [Oscillospiraceae bacterium]
MSRFLWGIGILAAGIACFSGCTGNDVPDNTVNTPDLPALSVTPPAPVDIIIQAEDAEIFGNVRLTSGGYLEGFEQDDDYCVFTVEIPADGFYDLNFVSAGIGGSKENHVSVNGERLGTVFVPGSDFTNSVMERVFLTEGTNEIALEKYWGWIRLDYLHITNSEPVDPSIFDVSARLINPNASENAKRLMSYLADSYGRTILAGQYSDDGLLAGESGIIFMNTGKHPAVLGLDLMDYTPSRVERGTQSRAVEHAVTADEHGAIITLCWHWNAPAEYITGTWYRAFYTEHTNIDLKKIMDGDDPDGYDLLMSDIDAIAAQLKRLADLDIPILWRPLHEAAGGWFWWGASGAEANIALWKLLYERLTFEHGLNNLIWLWSGEAADWYPGDEYVDIIGEDVYAAEHSYASQIQRFLQAVDYTSPPKMVVLAENGVLFDPDLAVRDGAMWGFFATWGGEFVRERNLLRYSERYTELEMLLKVYEHEIIVTLDELPDLKTYPIRED